MKSISAHTPSSARPLTSININSTMRTVCQWYPKGRPLCWIPKSPYQQSQMVFMVRFWCFPRELECIRKLPVGYLTSTIVGLFIIVFKLGKKSRPGSRIGLTIQHKKSCFGYVLKIPFARVTIMLTFFCEFGIQISRAFITRCFWDRFGKRGDQGVTNHPSR